MAMQGVGGEAPSGSSVEPGYAGLAVIPAVDLLGDEAVRLEQGRFDRVSVRAGRPEELVARFAAASPQLIHIVDLEGARTGAVRPQRIAALAREADPVPVQASGGIRSVSDALELLAAGAARVVVGTAAFADADGITRFTDALGEQLVIAIDARGGKVVVRGWEQETGLPVEEACAACAAAGVPRVLCTAIERDGTMAGPDLDLLGRVQATSGLPVIAAGGVSTLEDLDALATARLEGAIVGRALLEGRIPLSALGGLHSDG
jgi:phosphoribosylformimino-5-aminoimidazole carboxamide ribotide isomerase